MLSTVRKSLERKKVWEKIVLGWSYYINKEKGIMEIREGEEGKT